MSVCDWEGAREAGHRRGRRPGTTRGPVAGQPGLGRERAPRRASARPAENFRLLLAQVGNTWVRCWGPGCAPREEAGARPLPGEAGAVGLGTRVLGTREERAGVAPRGELGRRHQPRDALITTPSSARTYGPSSRFKRRGQVRGLSS